MLPGIVSPVKCADRGRDLRLLTKLSTLIGVGLEAIPLKILFMRVLRATCNMMGKLRELS
jgi:hypothetical protein